MSFLECAPSVFVIGEEYEILVNAKENGILYLEIGGEAFFEENAGVLATERAYAKIRVPQTVLDKAEAYTVVYSKTICHQAYFSEMGEPERESFPFRPIKKTDGVRIFYLSDVHSHFSLAEQAAARFADETDLYIMNGDVAEVEKEKDFLEVSIFLGQVAKGAVPIVFVRGNHDTRGKLSHFYTDFFPANGKDTYFTFSVGPIAGIALDCGEDKPDDYVYGAEYGYKSAYAGINRFAPFRRRELAWLKEQAPLTRPYRIAVSHICPMQTARRAGCEFDIEREVYTAFSEQLSRLGVQAMLCGHIHRAYTMLPGDGQSLLPHDFPIVVGAFLRGKTENGDALVGGTALLLENGKMQVRFTDKTGKETESTSLSLC
ncbi:MAG: metallophosphoesterase [Clostridia bacterium]|nr:metallophosphoesterase [Clostridia bacterium]